MAGPRAVVLGAVVLGAVVMTWVMAGLVEGWS